MYVRDVARKEFYEALGLDAREYDRMVIDKTNETSARVFPVVLDVKNPVSMTVWKTLLPITPRWNQSTAVQPCSAQVPAQTSHWIANGGQMASLFLMSPVRSEDYQPSVR